LIQILSKYPRAFKKRAIFKKIISTKRAVLSGKSEIKAGGVYAKQQMRLIKQRQADQIAAMKATAPSMDSLAAEADNNLNKLLNQ